MQYLEKSFFIKIFMSIYYILILGYFLVNTFLNLGTTRIE